MQLGESRERQRFEIRDVLAIAFRNLRQHIISAIVPRADGCMRVMTRDYAELRKRRRANESLIRKNFIPRRMIDGQQPHLIQINRFFHRLHETEAEQPVPGLHAARTHLQVLVRIRNVPFPGRDPVADHAGPDHVRDEFILAAIPRKQNGARAPAPIEFADAVHFLCRQIYFVLRHARRPQQPNDFGVTLRAQPGKNRGGVLPQIARRTGHLPFLIQRSRVEFDFRSDSALVVVQRLEVDAHPIVLITTLIAQNERRAAKLCHDQIRVAISIDICNRNRARLIQLDGIEMHIFGDVGPALAPKISQQPQFPSLARLTRGGQIEPAVIVVIERGNSPALLPA